MRKIILFSVLGALTLTGVAQTTQETATVTISGAEQRIVVPEKLYKMWPEEFYKFKGSYDLSNGQTLSLFSRGRAMYAQVDDQDHHQIVATDKNSFVALDRQLKMRIDLKDNGDVGGELYMVVPTAPKTIGKIEGEYVLMVAYQKS